MNARRRVERVQHILKEIGLEPERIEMFNTSAAMAGAFADAAKLMTERIESLGPNPLANHRGESQKENES